MIGRRRPGLVRALEGCGGRMYPRYVAPRAGREASSRGWHRPRLPTREAGPGTVVIETDVATGETAGFAAVVVYDPDTGAVIQLGAHSGGEPAATAAVRRARRG